MIGAFVEQGGVDFRRRLIGEARLVEDVARRLTFGGAEGAGRPGALVRLRYRAFPARPMAKRKHPPSAAVRQRR